MSERVPYKTQMFNIDDSYLPVLKSEYCIKSPLIVALNESLHNWSSTRKYSRMKEMPIPSPLIVDASQIRRKFTITVPTAYGTLKASQGHRSLVVGYIKVLGATKEQNWRQQKFSVTLKIRRNLSYVYSIRGLICKMFKLPFFCEF